MPANESGIYRYDYKIKLFFFAREDYELAHTLKSDEAKEQLYVELKSGAESGWDYSTRWIINNNTNKGE